MWPPAKSQESFLTQLRCGTANILETGLYTFTESIPISISHLQGPEFLTTSTYPAEEIYEPSPPPPLSSIDHAPSTPVSPEKPKNEALVIAPYPPQCLF